MARRLELRQIRADHVLTERSDREFLSLLQKGLLLALRERELLSDGELRTACELLAAGEGSPGGERG